VDGDSSVVIGGNSCWLFSWRRLFMMMTLYNCGDYWQLLCSVGYSFTAILFMMVAAIFGRQLFIRGGVFSCDVP